MPAIWTVPITWEVDQLVTADDMNEQVRDNLEYLLTPSYGQVIYNAGSDYTISNVTTFQDIDGTNLSITLNTNGGHVLLHLLCNVVLGDSELAAFDFTYNDGGGAVRVGAANSLGLAQVSNGVTGGSVIIPVEMTILLPALAAGSYVFRPQWRSGSGDAIALRSATSDNPVVFEAVEI